MIPHFAEFFHSKLSSVFHSQHMEFLIFSFQNIPLKTFEVHKCENTENTLKTKVFRKSILFANISTTVARIFMKFYVVLNYYLVSLVSNFMRKIGLQTKINYFHVCQQQYQQQLNLNIIGFLVNP